MHPTDDSAFLRQYAENHSDDAFAVLVARHVNLVYSVALRSVGDPHQAEEITQGVFILLAKKAAQLRHDKALSSWLFQATRLTARNFVRGESRRHHREQEAHMQSLLDETESDVWRQIAPLLDDAVAGLSETDRHAILLRFYEGRNLREVGAALGASEDAAEKRINRAVEKLRAFFARRGFTFSATVLATTIASQAVTAAPAGLAVSVTGAALAGAAAGGGITVTLLKLMSMAKTKTAMVIVVAIAAIIVLRWPNSIREKTLDAPQMNPVDAQPGNTKQDRPYVRRNSQTENLPKTPEPAKVRSIFHVVDAETTEGLPNTKIHAVYFYAGGRPERHFLVTDKTGSAAIPEPSEAYDQSMNVFVTAEGYVPKAAGFDGKRRNQAQMDDYGKIGNGRIGITVGILPRYTRVELPAEYTMKLEPALSVGGTVVDEQGRPVPEVKISVRSPGIKAGQTENINFKTSAVSTDANGRWLCTYVPKDWDELRLILTRDEFAVTLPIINLRKVDLTNLSLVIARGFAVTGRIADQEGNAIAGATVKEVNNTGYRQQTTTTAVDGTFMIQGLRDSLQSLYFVGGRGIHEYPKQPFRDNDLVVQAVGFAPQKQAAHLVEPTNVVNFTLVEGNTFRGRVVDEAGNPILGAVVQTDSDNQGIRKYEWTTHTDTEGRFEWDSAPEELVLFWFEADGYTVIRGLSLQADGSEHEIKLTR